MKTAKIIIILLSLSLWGCDDDTGPDSGNVIDDTATIADCGVDICEDINTGPELCTITVNRVAGKCQLTVGDTGGLLKSNGNGQIISTTITNYITTLECEVKGQDLTSLTFDGDMDISYIPQGESEKVVVEAGTQSSLFSADPGETITVELTCVPPPKEEDVSDTADVSETDFSDSADAPADTTATADVE